VQKKQNLVFLFFFLKEKEDNFMFALRVRRYNISLDLSIYARTHSVQQPPT